MKSTYEPVIGLEIHTELKTESKMFCGCSASFFGLPPNSNCCPVCLGLPGALPVPNRKAVEWAVMLGMALNCRINSFSKFDRKNYFYPDLPKGYQISQYDKPFAENGWIDIELPGKNKEDKSVKRIRIRRVHLEEDTGKLTHATVNSDKCTLIDFNRSGVPLVEIVTEPDIRDSEEARIFLKKLHGIITYLGISEADMEKGSMRLEPNISIRIKNQESRKNDTLPEYKVEVKNINSFSFVKKAIDFEITRQSKILDEGVLPKQETRGWDEKKGQTISQRSKEEAHDYRYFPEPDIPPVRFSAKDLDRIREKIPELPDDFIRRMVGDYGLTVYDAEVLSADRLKAEIFEQAAGMVKNNGRYKTISLKKVANRIINSNKKVPVQDILDGILQSLKASSLPVETLLKSINEVIDENPGPVSQYKSGKTGVIMFLVGQTMSRLKGQADPLEVRKMLEEKLK